MILGHFYLGLAEEVLGAVFRANSVMFVRAGLLSGVVNIWEDSWQ